MAVLSFIPPATPPSKVTQRSRCAPPYGTVITTPTNNEEMKSMKILSPSPYSNMKLSYSTYRTRVILVLWCANLLITTLNSLLLTTQGTCCRRFPLYFYLGGLAVIFSKGLNSFPSSGGYRRTRTFYPYIKSVVLYQMSYVPIFYSEIERITNLRTYS